MTSTRVADRPLFRVPDDAKSRRQVKTSLSLQFLHRVMRLDHLHYGLWEEQDSRDVAGLKTAQQRFQDHMLSLVPALGDGCRRVLDVGCGTGAASQALTEAGYEVDGLSPDPYQERVFGERLDRPFYLGRFQEFVPDWTYDVILMNESAQYIWLDDLLASVLRLAPGGTWLLCDYFVREKDGSKLSESGHHLGTFLERAQASGFELEVEEDVTEQTLPTLELGRQWLDEYIRPSVDLVTESAQEKRPRLFRLLGGVVRKQLRRLDELESFLDAETFARTKRYMIYRFRVPEVSGES